MKELVHKRILVAVESDISHFKGLHAPPLDRAATEQLLAHLSADLTALLPDIGQCSLSMAGCLYDQAQLLRPAYPVFDALQTMLESSYAGQRWQPRLLSLGANDGQLPLPALQPETGLVPSLLQTLPILVSTPPDQAGNLFDAMEHRFLEQGQLSAHSAKGVEAAFGIRLAHARFMTRVDLYAMLRMQLEQVGFLPLWELLDAALHEETSPVTVSGQHGPRFEWRDQAIHGLFETFDYWASQGGGKGQPADRQFLAGAYARWTREYRQYLTSLNAHGVPVRQYLAQTPGQALEGSFFIEEARHAPPEAAATITEHSAGELGTVAVTVVDDRRQFNYYPILPAGLNDLHVHIRTRGLPRGGVSFPGTIHHHASRRCLLPDLMARSS